MLRRPPTLPAHFVALALSAVLLALSYPLPGWGFLAWVALAPAGWLAATSRRPWRLVWTSSIVFALWWVWMLRWLWPVTGPGSLGVAAVQTSFWVAALWATNVCVRRKRLPVAVALPLCWVSLEYVRCVWPWGGFAWFTLAQTQAVWQSGERSYAAGSSGLFGAWGISAAIAAISGLISALILLLSGPVKDAGRTGPRIDSSLAMFMFVVCFLTIPSGCFHEKLKTPSGPLVGSVAVVQTNSPHSNKLAPTVATYEADFAALSALHAEASGVDASHPSPREGPGEGAREAEGSGTLPQPLPGGGESAVPALIVWPETTVPGKFNEAAQVAWERWVNTLPATTPDLDLWQTRAGMARRTKALIAQHGLPTVVGGSTEIESADPQKPITHNSAFLVDGDGQIVDRYDKIHRVPFGEYIPLPAFLKAWVLATVSPYDFDYSIHAGEAVTVFDIHLAPGESPGADDALRGDEAVGDGPRENERVGSTGARPLRPASPATSPEGRGVFRFATPICFEDTDAALCRRMVYDPETGEKRVDALINLTTNGWFGHLPSDEHPGGGLAWRSVRYQHLQLASLRAIENRVPVVRAVNTGASAVIDSTGRIVAMGRPGEAEVVRAELVLDGRRTLYAIVGDWPMRGLAGLTGLIVLWARFTTPTVLRRRGSRAVEQ